MNKQENFWIQISEEYIRDNSDFNKDLGIKAWSRMLSKISLDEIQSILECGSNIGRNVNYLNGLLPNATKSIIELSPAAHKIVTSKYKILNSFLGPISAAVFEKKFDLVFTSGVLIHIHPSNLKETMAKIYDFSNRFILVAEYFSRTPVTIEYRNQSNKLFKSDFGKQILNNFELNLIDYGFLWGYEFDNAGFDDITYWLFEKPI